ncbi:MAG: hypothetical protein V7784_16040, partial [Oceanospirillaceae bacterium]
LSLSRSLDNDKEGYQKSMKIIKRYLALVENMHKDSAQQQRYTELSKHYASGVEKNGIANIAKGSLGNLLR